MMYKKLTLKLDQEIIERAKKYASEKKVSLSKLIENYLNSVISETFKQEKIEVSPFVKSLSTDLKLPADYDYKKEYRDFLDEKYK